MVKTFNKNTSTGTTKTNKTVTTPQIGASLNGKNSVISTIQSFAKNIKAIDTESMGKKSADIKKAINGLNKAIEGSIELKGAKLTGEGSLVQTIRQLLKRFKYRFKCISKNFSDHPALANKIKFLAVRNL